VRFGCETSRPWRGCPEGGSIPVMGTWLYSVVVDTRDPLRLAAWWAGTLDWWPGERTPQECTVVPPEGEAGVPLVFCRTHDVDVPARRRQRLHLDLATRTPEHQGAHVLGLIADGALRADIGQGDAPWAVLTDPEGNQFCVLEPRPEYMDTGSVAAMVQVAHHPGRLAEFWQAASGWDIVRDGPQGASLRHPDGHGPYLEILYGDPVKQGKNRWHLDVAPHLHGDQDAEVARLLGLGATHVEIGQASAAPGTLPWTVLADPEGNEFCVLKPSGRRPH